MALADLPVTFFEINQMSGIDETRLDEASLDTLKDDNVLTERASDGNASVVANARREDYPDKEMLVELIDNRLVNVDVPSLVTPIYLSPPVFPFNFSYMVPGALEIANERYRTTTCTRTWTWTSWSGTRRCSLGSSTRS